MYVERISGGDTPAFSAAGAGKSHGCRHDSVHCRERRPWRETPLVESANLSQAAGCRRSRIFLKLETLQPSGSFKSRGLGNLVVRSMQRAKDPDRVHFFSSSAGNAGLGCVYAAKFVGRPSTVVVPMTTKPHMIAKIRAAGASEVVQHGASLKDADSYLKGFIIPKSEAEGEEPVYVSPFDHPDTWEGHSTMVDEMALQFSELGESAPELIVCSCGGGGLFNGLMQGIQAQGSSWAKTQVLLTETMGADSLARSLERQENTTMASITSIATSLGVARVSEKTFELVSEGHRTGRVRSTTLTDAEALMGCWRFAEDERILVEPACGVNLALCYGHRLKRALGRAVRPDEKVVMIVCGGSNVSTGMIEEWKQQFGDLTGDLEVVQDESKHVPSATLAPNIC